MLRLATRSSAQATAQSQAVADALLGVGFAEGLQAQGLFACGLAGEFDFNGVQPAIALDDAIDLGTGAGAPVVEVGRAAQQA